MTQTNIAQADEGLTQFDIDRLIPVAEVAKQLGIHIVTVRRMIKRGDLAGWMWLGNLYCLPEDIAKLRPVKVEPVGAVK